MEGGGGGGGSPTAAHIEPCEGVKLLGNSKSRTRKLWVQLGSEMTETEAKYSKYQFTKNVISMLSVE